MLETIKTARMTLRRFAMSDAPEVFDALQEGQIAKMIPLMPWPYTLVDAQNYISQVTSNEPQTYAISHQGAFAGAVGANGQLGYWLKLSAWGKGLATEAAQAVMAQRFAHDDSDLKSSHRIGNDASRRILLALGFCDTEVFDTYSTFENCTVEMQGMILTRSQWKATA